MDRFIVVNKDYGTFIELPLKSNMDRFIVFSNRLASSVLNSLKSNMDRFIALNLYPARKKFLAFKIQYG